MRWLKHTTSIVAAVSLIGLSAQAVTYAEEINNLPDEEISCLAKNIYFEAKNQGTGGWLAVSFVTLNRVKDRRYPNTICEVVYQGQTRPSWQDPEIMIPTRHRCQFSWYCDGKSDEIINTKIHEEISIMVNNYIHFGFDITDGATHYHADYVLPSWAKTKTKTIEIDDHIFYRWER